MHDLYSVGLFLPEAEVNPGSIFSLCFLSLHFCPTATPAKAAHRLQMGQVRVEGDTIMYQRFGRAAEI